MIYEGVIKIWSNHISQHTTSPLLSVENKENISDKKTVPVGLYKVSCSPVSQKWHCFFKYQWVGLYVSL